MRYYWRAGGSIGINKKERAKKEKEKKRRRGGSKTININTALNKINGMSIIGNNVF